MADPKSKTRADLAAVAEKQAHSLADMAAGFGKATGILVSEMTEFDLFAFSARLAKGAMAACGVLKYLRLETSSVEAAAEFAANCPDPEQAANALKYAEFIDVGTTLLKNFSARGDDQQKAPEPISSGVKRWAAELTSPLHFLPTPALAAPVAVAAETKVADEARLRAIRAKAAIGEDEAAGASHIC